jgi:zinc protease
MTPLFRLALIACASSCLCAPAQAQAPLNDKAWVHAQSDIAPDPAVRFGQLANGMRYAILKNDTPAHQTAIRLRIGSGSTEERDDQQGLAHFLEHMAFKGSTHVPEGEMIKLLERRGLAFGPDTNAQTGFTETVFMLDLPESDPATLDLGLMLMRETASELTLSQSAMNPERGVVLSEERLRDTPDYEVLKKQLQFQLLGQLAPNRFPIGKPDILKTAPVSLIRDYYAANYRPDRAQLIVVGDIDPEAIEAQIRAKFSSWTGVGPETKTPDYGHIAVRGPQAQLIVQPGAHASVSLSWVKPFENTPETEAKDQRQMREQIAVAVLNRRLERAAREEDAPFISAEAGVSDDLKSARVTSLRLTPKPGAWKQGLTAAIRVQRQAAQFGATQAEVDREITEMRTEFQTAAAGAATRRTPDIANELVRSIDDGEVFTSPAQDLARFDRDVKTITAADISKALRTLFDGQGPLLSVASPDPIAGGQATVQAAFAAAETAPIAADVAVGDKAWPYVRFGEPGALNSQRQAADLGVTFVTFSNGVRLNIKPTDFRKDQVLVSVRLGEGRLDLPKDRKTEIWADQALILGGLGKITLEDMEQVLADKLISTNVALMDDSLALGGATRPKDLDTEMQVLAAYVSDAAFRPSAFERVRESWATQLDQLDATPQGVLARDLARLEHSGDPRWGLPTQADVKDATPAAFAALLRPILATAPLEVDVVGDVNTDAVIRAVGETFGALPPRPAPAPPTPAQLAVRFPSPVAAPVALTHAGRADQAIALQAWPSAGLFADPQAARVVNVAAEVLEMRLIDRVRFAEGATYSPAVNSSPSDVFPTYGVVSASVETPPAKIAGFYAALREITADLIAHGPTADELNRALKPRIETLAKAQQTNEYWLTWLAGSEQDPRRLQVVRDTLPGYRKITAEQVQAAAARDLTEGKAWRLTVTPK